MADLRAGSTVGGFPVLHSGLKGAYMLGDLTIGGKSYLEGEVIVRSKLHVEYNGSPGIEIRSLDGGTPYLDFTKNSSTDYDVRLILTTTNEVSVQGGYFRGEEFITGGWYRAEGNTGFYFQTHGGGWYMSDTTWIRAYNNKSIYTPGTIKAGTLEADGYLYMNSAGGEKRILWEINGSGGMVGFYGKTVANHFGAFDYANSRTIWAYNATTGALALEPPIVNLSANCYLESDSTGARLHFDSNSYFVQTDTTAAIYINGASKHFFKADGTKTGGSIVIDGENLGMSPVDSPRVLITDIITDIQLNPIGIKVSLESRFAKAISGYSLFHNNASVVVLEKGKDYFIVKGEGIADFQVTGTRIGFEGKYWDDMNAYADGGTAKVKGE
jgi:hypothetical protein